jgi:hypothetical protein
VQLPGFVSQVSADRCVVKVNTNQIDKSNSFKANPLQKYKLETALNVITLWQLSQVRFEKHMVGNSTEMMGRNYSKYSPLLNARVHSGRQKKH